MADATAIAAAVISALAIVATAVLAIATYLLQQRDKARADAKATEETARVEMNAAQDRARVEALAARLRQQDQQESLAVRQEKRLQALEVRYAEVAAPAMAQVREQLQITLHKTCTLHACSAAAGMLVAHMTPVACTAAIQIRLHLWYAHTYCRLTSHACSCS
jgi:hypothetical protein